MVCYGNGGWVDRVGDGYVFGGEVVVLGKIGRNVVVGKVYIDGFFFFDCVYDRFGLGLVNKGVWVGGGGWGFGWCFGGCGGGYFGVGFECGFC